MLNTSTSVSTWRARCALLVLAFGALGAGCGEEDDPSAGVLVVPYELGNRKDCGSVGVKIVRAELDDGMYVEEALCDAGEIRFQQLPPGAYDLRVFGVDSQGVAVMDSLQSGDVPVSVIGEGTTVVADPAVTLTAAPAHLLLRWGFGFGTCDSAAIDRFQITAWRSDGSDLLLETEVPCGMEGEGAEQYRLLPDRERELSGEEVGEVTVQAIDKNGVAIGDAASFRFDPPGPGRYVPLSVTCDAGGCAGVGVPD